MLSLSLRSCFGTLFVSCLAFRVFNTDRQALLPPNGFSRGASHAAAPTERRDGSAGIGIELETSGFRISPVGECPFDDIRAGKGQVINGVRGRKWKLTADRVGEQLDLEYIMDGTAIKLGTMEANTVVGEIERHLIYWNAKERDEIIIEGSQCKWQVNSTREMRDLRFTPQITVPLPLSAIYDILRGAEFGTPNPHFLDHFERPGQERVIVTKEFFQSRPFGMDPETVDADVLGFLSIILSWAKGTINSKSGMLFKGLSWIMPRTSFAGLYDEVDDRLPRGRLSELLKVLACYRNDYSGPQSTRHNIILDDRFCTGSLDNPVPFDTMDTLRFKVFRKEDLVDTLLVSDWIDDIQNKVSPDRLGILGERWFSPSIGGHGPRLETMYGNSRKVPLFEIRDLKDKKPREFQRFVVEAEEGIIEYSRRYSDAAEQGKV